VNLSTANQLKQASGLYGSVVLSEQQLKDLKAVLLEILDDVTEFCDQHNLTYMLGGGTCLGAIRHKGFIPWDDDIDINMPRESYNRFMDLFPKAYSEKYSICDPRNTQNYGLGMAHVRMKGTIDRSHSDIGLKVEECGIYIDIFVLENVPDVRVFRYLHGGVSMLLGFIVSCRRFARFADAYMRIAGDNAEAAKVFRAKIRIGRLASFKSLEGWARAWDSWNSACKNRNSKYVTFPVGRNHYFREMLSRETFFPTSKAIFEGRSLAVAGNTDAYLSRLYGDYMKLPPHGSEEEHVVMEFSLGKYATTNEAENSEAQNGQE